MLPDVLIILSLLLLAWACRTYNNRYIAKLGWVAIVVASYFSGYFVSGNEPLWGIMGVALWFVFPWVEILGRVSKLRFPIISEVKHRFPPSRDIFPDLDEISSEVEASGFEQTDDAGWKWEDTDNFVRIFYHQAKRLQATINIAQQGDFVFSHACLTTRTEDGHAYMTTNYPFSLTMKLGPKQIMNRCNDAEVFEDMLQSHESFLAKQQIADIQRQFQFGSTGRRGQQCHRALGHVALFGNQPLFVGLDTDRRDESQRAGVVGEDPDHSGAALGSRR